MSAGKSTGASHKAKLPEGKDLDAVIRELVSQIEALMQHFVEEEDVESGLSPRDRQRLISAGDAKLRVYRQGGVFCFLPIAKIQSCVTCCVQQVTQNYIT